MEFNSGIMNLINVRFSEKLSERRNQLYGAVAKRFKSLDIGCVSIEKEFTVNANNLVTYLDNWHEDML